MGNIKWSAVSVKTNMERIEAAIEPIFPHLAKAEEIVKETLELPNLPDYMKNCVVGVSAAIHWVAGYGGEKKHDGSRLINEIHRVINQLPEGSVETEEHRTKHGVTHKLI